MVQPTEIGVKQRGLETEKGEKTPARKKPIEATPDLPAIDEFLLRTSHCIFVVAAAVPIPGRAEHLVETVPGPWIGLVSGMNRVSRVLNGR